MYTRNKKLIVNKKRLTKKEVQRIIETEGILNNELSTALSETFGFGNPRNRPRVYNLKTGNYLFVFDEGNVLDGKGDIYLKEAFEKIILWYKKIRLNSQRGLGSSGLMWKHYSKLGATVFKRSEILTEELSRNLQISLEKLDYSYKSLDLISSKMNLMEEEYVKENYYDHLVSYVGEVIKKRVNGEWKIKEAGSDMSYPVIDNDRCLYMPINVLSTSFNVFNGLSLRVETANEVRRNSWK